jgi:hypothetical protein
VTECKPRSIGQVIVVHAFESALVIFGMPFRDQMLNFSTSLTTLSNLFAVSNICSFPKRPLQKSLSSRPMQ